MMTHRGLQNKRDRVLRYLDLCIDGRQQNDGNVPRNTPRDQSGTKDGRRAAPQSRGAAKKPFDYTAQLEEDIERLLEEPNHGPSTASSRVEPGSSPQPSYSSDFALAHSKQEEHHGINKYNRIISTKSADYTGKEDRPLHRQNHAHKYLMATEKRPKTAGYEGNPRLGRPTRTTLLRARQRCNSAPVSTYESRHEVQKRANQRAEVQNKVTSQLNHSLSDLLSVNVPPGESLRGYLIGARYNRAHHVDDKSLKEYGVYIPRNPSGTSSCFMIKRMKLKSREQEQQDQEVPSPPASSQPRPRAERPVTASTTRQRLATPSPPSPPSSPLSPRVNGPSTPHTSEYAPSSSRSAEHHPSLVITPQLSSRSTGTRQAWSDKTRLESSSHLGPEADPPSPTSKDRPIPPMSFQVINTSDGIGIQGHGFIGSPPKVARPMTGRARSSINRSPKSDLDADVMVQGRSLQTFLTSAAMSAHVESGSSSSSWVPRPLSARAGRPKTAVNRKAFTARDVSRQLQHERDEVDFGSDHHTVPVASPEVPLEAPSLDTSEIMSVESEEDSAHRMSGPSPSPIPAPHPTPNLPSTLSPEPRASVTVSEEPKVLLESYVNVTESPVEDGIAPDESMEKESSGEEKSEKLTPIISRSNRAPSARIKKSRVRFADEVFTNSEHSLNDKQGEEPVFLTEKNMYEGEESEVGDVIGEKTGESLISESLSGTTMEDAGDTVEVTGENVQNEITPPSEDFLVGSGDFLPDEEEGDKVPGLLNVHQEETDDCSVLSDELHAPREVISVDITPKTPTDNKSSLE